MKRVIVIVSLIVGLIAVTFSSVASPVAAASSSFVPLPPARLADTRPEYGDYGTPSVPKGLTIDGGTIRVPVAGRYGVASNAAAVAINLTATQATSRGYLTVYACDTAPPSTSNVNLQPGNPVANLVLSNIGAKGDICIFTRGTTHLIVDVVGYIPTNSSPFLVTPTRIGDTRPENPDYGTPSIPKALTTDGGTIRIPIAGRAGVASDAAAVAINLTSTQATSRGYLTVYACDATVPNTSNVNLQPGNPVANLVLTNIGAKGDICIFTRGTTHLIVDVVGTIPKGAAPALVSTRIADTRVQFGDYGSPSVPKGPTTDGATIRIPVTGRAGVPSDAAAVGLNLTAVQATSRGYLTVYACDTAMPNTSNVNLQPDNPVANLVFTKVGAKGDICIFTRGNTALIVDLVAYLPGAQINPPTTSTTVGPGIPPATSTTTTLAPDPGCTINGVTVITDLYQAECSALVALYNATNGPNWIRKAGWNTGTDPCTWSGVSCITKKLAKVELGANRLAGNLPSEIGGLKNLAVLDLRFNQIGSVPPEFANLTNLTSLNLSGNGFTTVPAEIYKLPNLTNLDLGFNKLPAIPTEVVQLTKLTRLSLRDNQGITTIPAEIGGLTELADLNLFNNQIAAIPPAIGKLTNLTNLDLGANAIVIIPPEIGKLTKLTKLNFGANRIVAFPPEIGSLTKLTNLDMSANQIKIVPPEVGNLTELTNLNLGFNQLTAIPADIGKLTKLTSLNLGSNQITTIPDEIGKLTNLVRLDITINRINALPADIGNLSKLQNLEAWRNQITTIPPEIGKLADLTNLNLGLNRITSLPTNLGSLTKLEVLLLSFNQISGDVSVPLAPLASANRITFLTLGNNNCPTASNAAVRTWLNERSPGWDKC